MEHLTAEDKANKIRGFKSTLSNDTVSHEAKQHAREQLKALGAGDFDDPNEPTKNPNNVAGGLKAAIHNPNVTAEGQEQAEEKLRAM